MNFMKDLEKTTAATLTENMALAVDTTTSKLVDLFAISGAMRSRTVDEISDKMDQAFDEDRRLATKLAFYTRDVREGLGERRAGRIMLYRIALKEPELIIKNLHLFAEYGRFDDLFILFGTACEEAMVEFVIKTLKQDLKNMHENKPVSLLAKWMPSINTSSYETRKLAKAFVKAMKVSERAYRKMLADLRKYIQVVEVKMSANLWNTIDYEIVSSNAMNRYDKVFLKHDEEGFKTYIQNVKTGKAKINSSVLYPYNIVEKLMYGYRTTELTKQVANEQWKALPNYIEGENNYLVMADVSESMYGRPMATSVGLAIYFAERNSGPFAGKYMTFSEVPKIMTVRSDSIFDKVQYVMRTDIGYDTDLEAAFEAVLLTAIRSKCSQEDMPKSIIIISDMEINNYHISGGNFTFLDEMKYRFKEAGYELPNVVFWNVDSRHNTFHAFEDDSRVQLVSGQSTTVFKQLIDSFNYTPYEMMLKALNSPRYELLIQF